MNSEYERLDEQKKKGRYLTLDKISNIIWISIGCVIVMLIVIIIAMVSGVDGSMENALQTWPFYIVAGLLVASFTGVVVATYGVAVNLKDYAQQL